MKRIRFRLWRCSFARQTTVSSCREEVVCAQVNQALFSYKRINAPGHRLPRVLLWEQLLTAYRGQSGYADLADTGKRGRRPALLMGGQIFPHATIQTPGQANGPSQNDGPEQARDSICTLSVLDVVRRRYLPRLHCLRAKVAPIGTLRPRTN